MAVGRWETGRMRGSGPGEAVRFAIIFLGHLGQGLDRGRIEDGGGEAAAAPRLGAERFGLAGVGDVDHQVDGADQAAGAVEDRGGIGAKMTRLPSGRSATATTPRIGRRSRIAIAIGQRSCASWFPDSS